jgi:probable HAF family extracellular repeat protein
VALVAATADRAIALGEGANYSAVAYWGGAHVALEVRPDSPFSPYSVCWARRRAKHNAQCVKSLSEITGCATEWSGGSVIKLGSLPGFTESGANGINDAGQAVGFSLLASVHQATEWSGGSVISLGNLPGATFSIANGINAAGQAVGYNIVVGMQHATKWSGGSIIDLGGLPGSISSVANDINDTGQSVGYSQVGDIVYATEWSGGSAINLEGLPGSTFSEAYSINNAGQAVGFSVVGGVGYATEWSGGSIFNLGLGAATGINDVGQVVGAGPAGAIEWSGGSTINLGPGQAFGINNSGQVVGEDAFNAVEWSGGGVFFLAGPPGSIRSEALRHQRFGTGGGDDRFLSHPRPRTRDMGHDAGRFRRLSLGWLSSCKTRPHSFRALGRLTFLRKPESEHDAFASNRHREEAHRPARSGASTCRREAQASRWASTKREAGRTQVEKTKVDLLS